MHTNMTLNLQRMAMIKFSRCIWHSTEIQEELKYIFYENECLADEFDFKEFTRDEIFSKLKNLNLPTRCKSELFHVIKEMGNEVFALHVFLTRSDLFVNNKLNYTKKLYWTPLGKIDVKKLIVPNLLENLQTYALIRIFDICLDHCPYEQYRGKVWALMPMHYENHLLTTTERAAGFWYVNRQTADWFKRKFKFAIDERLLRHFVAAGYCEFVNSLWPQLDKSMRNAVIMEAFDIACRKSRSRYHVTPGRYEEIVVFLFVNMTDSQKLEVVRDPRRRGWRILQRLMSWPWLSLLVPTLQLFWANIDQDSDVNVSNDCLHKLIAAMIEEAKFGYSTVMFDVLREVYQRMPNKLKLRFDFTDTVREFMECRSLSSLKHLVNCSLFKLKKDNIVETVMSEYMKIITEKAADRDDQLNEFVIGVFETNEERDVFRKSIRRQSDYTGREGKRVKRDLL